MGSYIAMADFIIAEYGSVEVVAWPYVWVARDPHKKEVEESPEKKYEEIMAAAAIAAKTKATAAAKEKLRKKQPMLPPWKK